jgi:hypothetical protein
VGLGGTRTSNGAVAILSNTGFLGGLAYFGFVIQSLFRRPRASNQQDLAVASAVFWAFLPPFTSGLLASTTPDFGILNAYLFGLALAVTLPPRMVPMSSSNTSAVRIRPRIGQMGRHQALEEN